MTRKEKLQNIDPKNIIVFDTETTGLNVGGSRRDEILSLAIMNLNGDVLFNDLVRPAERKKWPKAESINGISPAMVKDKKTLLERRNEIEPIFKSAKLYVAYNAEFDLGFLRAAGLDIPNHKTFDVMKEFANIHGEWNERHEEWAWCKLEDCAAFYGCLNFGAHDALSDVKATAHCFTSILNDFLFGEPRRRPKRVEDESGETYLDYGDEEIRDIVCSGYAESLASSGETASESHMPTIEESATNRIEKSNGNEKLNVSNVVSQPSARKTNRVLVALGIVCAAVGVLIAVFGAVIVGAPIAILGVLLAVGAMGKK